MADTRGLDDVLSDVGFGYFFYTMRKNPVWVPAPPPLPATAAVAAAVAGDAARDGGRVEDEDPFAALGALGSVDV